MKKFLLIAAVILTSCNAISQVPKKTTMTWYPNITVIPACPLSGMITFCYQDTLRAIDSTCTVYNLTKATGLPGIIDFDTSRLAYVDKSNLFTRPNTFNSDQETVSKIIDESGRTGLSIGVTETMGNLYFAPISFIHPVMIDSIIIRAKGVVPMGNAIVTFIVPDSLDAPKMNNNDSIWMGVMEYTGYVADLNLPKAQGRDIVPAGDYWIGTFADSISGGFGTGGKRMFFTGGSATFDTDSLPWYKIYYREVQFSVNATTVNSTGYYLNGEPFNPVRDSSEFMPKIDSIQQTKGYWTPSTNYVGRDIVIVQSEVDLTLQCKTAHTSSSDEVFPLTDIGYWDIMSITTPSGGSGAPGGANMELQYDSLNHFAGTKGIRYSPSFPQLSFTGASAKGIEIVNNAGTGGLRLWSDTREGIEFSNTLEIQAAGSSDDFLTFYNVGDSLTLGFDRTYNATTWKNSKRLVSQGAFRAKIESMLAGSGTLDSLRLAFLDKANVFTDSLRIPLRAYSSAWKNSTAAPAMGDLYTKIESITGGTMTYPSGSGIPIVVSGISWGSTITNNSSNWNTAYGWGNHASVGYVTGTPWTAMGYVTGTPWTGLGYLTSLSGAVLTDQSTPQTIGATGSRLAKLWATDITVTNAITGGVTGNAGTVTVGSETADEQCFPLFGTSSTGNLSPKTNGGNFWYNSATNNLYATTFTGALAGNASSATNSTNTSNIYITSKSDNTSYSPVVVDNTGNTPTYVPATGFTMNPSTGLFTIGALKVTGGTPGAGKVLTSDATGNATWQSIESILTVRATLSAAEIQTSGSSPKVLVSAPGSGYAIEVISATLKWIAGSSAYTVGCQLGVGTGSAGVWQNYWASYGLLTNVTRIQKSLNTDGISVSNLHDNGALTVSNTSGSDPANGNGTAVVYVTYRIITL